MKPTSANDGSRPGGADARAVPVVLDGGDRRCVQLLIELSRLVADLPPGSVVHLIATDPAAPLDLPAWCHLTGQHYLGPLPGTDRPTYALRVRADAAPTHPQAPWRLTGPDPGGSGA
ncbi:sulfurtransferase TusA family protein [Nonomuraea indica]|uniref:sulfurtransferase TusA family protein n=1 Tax=Nonomuraea indica TaxID=1581193 RepID=UPI000C79EB7D|nr:sulfurtransferase TusA family protein [Nonomuraea indica]